MEDQEQSENKDKLVEAKGQLQNHAFIEAARILIQQARVESTESFVRRADVWLDEWVSREDRYLAAEVLSSGEEESGTHGGGTPPPEVK